jgi:GTP cyclohydrolase I
MMTAWGEIDPEEDPRPRFTKEGKFVDSVRHMLMFIGENPFREGLRETPERVRKAWLEMFSGYAVDPKTLFTTFEDPGCKQMIICAGIPYQSTCEHHLLPFTGVAHVAYLPNGKVIGLSKLARIVDCYAKRLQIQEQMTEQITRCLDEHLDPLGAACVLVGEHSCMSCRGVKKHGAKMVTSSLTKEFLKPEVRGELFSLIALSRT